MSGDPLDVLSDIEQQASPTMRADQELAMIKAPMYQAQKNADLMTETTINQVYQKLIEKNAVIQALLAENAKLKKMMEKVETPPTNTQDPAT